MIPLQVILEPSIQVERITIADIESSESGIKYSQYFGHNSPLIKVGGILYFGDMIVSMKIMITKLIPHIYLVITSNDGLFNDNHPTDGDVVSVYLKSKHKDFKSIVMDFRITSTSPSISQDDRNYSNNIPITGVMDVKDLFSNKIKSVEGDTIQSLKSVCEDLNIGLASNVMSCDDKMVHICALNDYKDFIKSIAMSAWKSESTFFDIFIDQYYHLSLVDVESVISNPIEPVVIEYAGIMKSDYIISDNDNDVNRIPLMLSNSQTFVGTPFHIVGWSINSKSSVSLKSGYRRFISYDDQDEKNHEEFFIDPIFDDESKIINRGRKDESHESNIKYSNRGFQSDNVHENYYYAIEHNKFNLSELRKFGMRVGLTDINPYIYRGGGINVEIFDKPQQGSDIEGEPETRNDFLSGYYYVDGITYSYNSSTGQYNTELKLSKREYDKVQ